MCLGITYMGNTPQYGLMTRGGDCSEKCTSDKVAQPLIVYANNPTRSTLMTNDQHTVSIYTGCQLQWNFLTISDGQIITDGDMGANFQFMQ